MSENPIKEHEMNIYQWQELSRLFPGNQWFKQTQLSIWES